MDVDEHTKTLARKSVARAIKKGLLIRPNLCSNCTELCKPKAHHDDYSKPLIVRWLCDYCHMEYHGELRDKKIHEKILNEAVLASKRILNV